MTGIGEIHDNAGRILKGESVIGDGREFVSPGPDIQP
jgi:hypothetical protein